MTAPAATRGALSPGRAAFTRRWTPRLVAFGEFIDGYDLLVMGAALLFLKPAFHLTAGQTGWLGAISFIGAAVGLVVFGDLSDRFGRKIIFMVNLAFFVIASVVSAFVANVPELMAARFVIGVAVGMDIPTSHSFLAEISPGARRGRVAGSLPNVMWLVGAIVSVLLALVVRPLAGDATWRWLFGLAAIPALAILIARQFLPESPRWLRAHGQHDKARQVFRALGIPEPEPAAEPARRYRDLLDKGTGIRLLAVTGFFALQSFGGAVTTISGPLVLSSTGLGTSFSLYFSLAGFIGGLIAVLAGALVIDRVSRRKMGGWSCLAVFLAGIGMAVSGKQPAVLLVCYVAFSMLTWFGPGVLAWVWSAEMFPTRVRALGEGIAQSVTRLAIALNVGLVPTLLGLFGTRAIAIYACAYLACVLIVLASPFFDTGGRELEQVSR